MDAILGTCKGAAWASDPSQSLWLLCPARMASLNLLAMLQAQGPGLQSAEQELAFTLSPDEFRTFRDALVTTGRTFRDFVKAGGVWLLSASAAASAVAPSVVGVGSTGSGSSTGLSAFSAERVPPWARMSPWRRRRSCSCSPYGWTFRRSSPWRRTHSIGVRLNILPRLLASSGNELIQEMPMRPTQTQLRRSPRIHGTSPG